MTDIVGHDSKQLFLYEKAQAELLHGLWQLVANRSTTVANIGQPAHIYRPAKAFLTLAAFVGLDDSAGDACPPESSTKVYGRVCRFFRALLADVEGRLGLVHYKLAVEWPAFQVVVIESTRTKAPPAGERCISCDTTTPGAGSRLDFPATNLHRVWLDAKARPMLIITPTRHCERLSQCTDDELATFWWTAARAMQQELGVGVDMLAGPAAGANAVIRRLTLNHGNARNIAHLHLKILVRQELWKKTLVHRWSDERRAQWDALDGGRVYRNWRVRELQALKAQAATPDTE
ncbi:hypothetical protein THASP1DRAFT_27517 [Thamnocephalis sphaerospora]|uniref:HIT-like domain-containing protein n=1 Tax=Thamnocephalis sphaerospora TaxID=78915 RepID=A0A4P9XWJ1_9FUNG|nr:hypothetical protein THASP1DRAFT_27517 [Thamnocephalis sphaerospora]|eukprot:RKP10678.1 hypothetical protein THASP1DRAFT_27517 [Thamnocephalis sphaerospora]